MIFHLVYLVSWCLCKHGKIKQKLQLEYVLQPHHLSIINHLCRLKLFDHAVAGLPERYNYVHFFWFWKRVVEII